ncbi:class I SAM-dependent methyltransferase [Micavibrio aeruginosavorus]|uniref:Methyltransferase domain protein n=1 Tax=Micavibrio aeruginosavorus (strain ARL-13) TaxID=856793 RepID=G2KSF8_MICAA|nr:class I SAM-dependent methyltransferase [Micavibrio aeruginosavorus]AEP09242.1 methyltransferase domain protein [Micavibrio aeruginosavorus ARL-13]
MTNFFTAEISKSYDERNSRVAAVADNMHFLIRLLLKDLPINARILCVGVGTGAEILSLARLYPEWSFVGIDPSIEMLDVCRQNLKNAGLSHRCELIQGYIQDIVGREQFDAVLSILVGHFIARDERTAFYTGMQQQLKPGGYLINTEISFDLNSAEFPDMLHAWQALQMQMGGTEDSIKNIPNLLKNILCVISPAETEDMLRISGIPRPVRFFQSFMISGWFGVKA